MNLADFAARLATTLDAFRDGDSPGPLRRLLYGLADTAKAEHERQTEAPPFALAFHDFTDGELEQLRDSMAKLVRESTAKVEIMPAESVACRTFRGGEFVPAEPEPTPPAPPAKTLETLKAERRYRVVRVPGVEVCAYARHVERVEPDLSWLHLCPSMDGIPADAFLDLDWYGSPMDPRDDIYRVTAYHESFEPVADAVPHWSSFLFC